MNETVFARNIPLKLPFMYPIIRRLQTDKQEYWHFYDPLS